MAVTVVGKTITLTAQGDEVALPLVIKSIHWYGATTAGHLLQIGESDTLGDPANEIYHDEAAGANYVSRSLIEKYYPKGIELQDLDSGAVDIIYE